MNSIFSLTQAQKGARVMRAARKELGLTQIAVAKHLEVSQSKVAKMEKGVLMPGALEWLRFCELTQIPFESLESGYIDRNEMYSADGNFKLPEKYSADRGTKARTLRLILENLERHEGAEKVSRFLSHLGFDPDFFVNLSHEVNLQFFCDASHFQIEQGYIRESSLRSLVEPLSSLSFHGVLKSIYHTQPGTFDLVRSLLQNVNHYEENFTYETLSEKGSSLDFSITPRAHVERFSYDHLGTYLCDYKKEFLRAFVGMRRESKLHLHEKECFFKGGSRCLYQVMVA